jgi:hypothetical protein
VNLRNENQHYISKVLLKRFKKPCHALQCYQIATRQWVAKSIERLCAEEGYNQLIVPGGATNNALEASMSAVESMLPRTFKAIDIAANNENTELPPEIYHNLRLYCAFLKLSSLFSKASAVANFVVQLNIELERGEQFLWRDLGTAPEVVAKFRKAHAAGGRIIVEAENLVQLIYRVQFERLLRVNLSEMCGTDWTVSLSPIDLPMSDIGLIPIRLEDLKANHYLLPIGPRVLLEGVFYHELSKNQSKKTIKGITLDAAEAEYRLDCICLSSVREIISSERNVDIQTSLDRAKKRRLSFHRITDLDLITAAGTKVASTSYSLKVVSLEEYRRFVHSFIMPPDR